METSLLFSPDFLFNAVELIFNLADFRSPDRITTAVAMERTVWNK